MSAEKGIAVAEATGWPRHHHRSEANSPWPHGNSTPPETTVELGHEPVSRFPVRKSPTW
jgi:hypothetical protein